MQYSNPEDQQPNNGQQSATQNIFASGVPYHVHDNLDSPFTKDHGVVSAFSSRVSAYATSATGLSGGETKITFQGEDFDGLGEFDQGVNYRFTPTEAGYYQVTAQVSISVAEVVGTEIKKNGTTVLATAKGTTSSLAAKLIYLLPTDYIEIYAFKPDTIARNTTTGIDQTYLTIHRFS